MTKDNARPLMHPWDADGGPAFPLQIDEDSPALVTFKGMSLRDYFAGQALAGCAVGNPPALLAEWAYQLSDAMLAQRKKQEG